MKNGESGRPGKKISILLMVIVFALLIFGMAGCMEIIYAPSDDTAKSVSATQSQEQAPSTAVSVAPAKTDNKPYIAFIAKGFQHPFWQNIFKGAADAADKFGADITFEGPPSESDVSMQVDMLNAVIAKKPNVICIAALDTNSIMTQLFDCKTKGITVIGFDSGVPNAPVGTIAGTVATDNEKAAAKAADQMIKDPAFQAALKAATTSKPVIVGVQSMDATNISIIGRTTGFVNEMVKNCETAFPGQVAVIGNTKWAKAAASGKAAVQIYVMISSSLSTDDQTAASRELLGMNGFIGIFCSNSSPVDGLIAATYNGSDLDKTSGKYKDLVVVGFDAGKTQKDAVRKGWFLGSVTQDPYRMGFEALKLAFKAYKGEKVSDVDTGCKFYDASNMDQPDIAPLLYD